MKTFCRRVAIFTGKECYGNITMDSQCGNPSNMYFSPLPLEVEINTIRIGIGIHEAVGGNVNKAQ